MLLVKPSFTIDPDMRSGDDIIHRLRLKANTCYKPEKESTKSDYDFMYDLVHNKKHTSVLRHEQASMKLVCSRSVSHQIVRHGLAHFLQESQRYCNYSKKNNGEVVFIIPFWLHDKIEEGVYKPFSMLPCENNVAANAWFHHNLNSETYYHLLIEQGWKPERARGVLPNDAKTEVEITANLEEWRHIFKQRADSHADESMQHLMYPALAEFKKRIPVIFDDLFS
jgi:thymidylate synthase (FAD)